MSMRIARTIALAAGAGALVLGMAAPAMADDLGTGASKVTLVTGTSQVFQVPLDTANPTAPCPANVDRWEAKKASKNMSAINVVTTTVTTPTAGQPCVLSVEIAAPAGAKKRNAVVKVIGTNSQDATVKVVKTIVVKVTGTKPGKGPKN